MYISIDIETDGPAPGHNSMLSLGAAAFTIDGGLVDAWYQKVEPLMGAVRDPDTMKWWESQQKEVWEEANSDQVSPFYGMVQFSLWLEKIGEGHKLVAAAWPAAFDFAFVNFYMWRFAGRNPLGFACLDIRSYANGMFSVPGYYEKIPEGDLYLKYGIDTTGFRPHVSVDDAVRQGMLLVALLKDSDIRNDQP